MDVAAALPPSSDEGQTVGHGHYRARGPEIPVADLQNPCCGEPLDHLPLVNDAPPRGEGVFPFPRPFGLARLQARDRSQCLDFPHTGNHQVDIQSARLQGVQKQAQFRRGEGTPHEQ